MFDWLHLLERPWGLLLLALPLLSYGYHLWKKPLAAALLFSDTHRLAHTVTWRTLTYFLPTLILLVSWCLFVIAICGPRKGKAETMVTTEGIAMAFVVDQSGSMMAPDILDKGEAVTRMRMLEKVFIQFVEGDKNADLAGRPNDFIGVVGFNQYTTDLCPLTLDHIFLVDILKNSVQAFEAEASRENQNSALGRTFIWDGVAMGADMLHQSEKILKKVQKEDSGSYTIKSKVLIVLSDGEDNGSSISNMDAVRIAKEFGIKIYAIAIHGSGKIIQTIFGPRQVKAEYDDEPLKRIAEETGGRMFQVTHNESLQKVMADIDKLEKSEIYRQVSMEYTPIHRPFIMIGFFLFLLGHILRHTLYRELP